MSVDPEGGREICREEGCRGDVAEGGRCLGHLEADKLDHVLARMKRDGTLAAQGVVLGEELLERVLHGFAERDERGIRVVADVEFDEATFEGSQVDFRNTIFSGRARFNGAAFRGPVSFAGSIFKHSPMFEGARFEHDANFGHRGPDAKYAPGFEPVFNVVFERRGQFANATFKGAAVFRDASFGLEAYFDAAVFETGLDLQGARFESLVSLSGAEIRQFAEADPEEDKPLIVLPRTSAELHCDGAEFGFPFSLREARLGGGVSFGGTRFKAAADFAGQTFRQRADFSGAEFGAGANFGSCEFHVFPNFGGASFAGETTFSYSKVSGEGSQASFGDATFHGDASFEGVAYTYGVSFAGAQFDRRLDPPKQSRGTSIVQQRDVRPAPGVWARSSRTRFVDRTLFKQASRMEKIAADSLMFAGTQFIAGANLRVRWAETALHETEFGRPSLAVGVDYDSWTSTSWPTTVPIMMTASVGIGITEPNKNVPKALQDADSEALIHRVVLHQQNLDMAAILFRYGVLRRCRLRRLPHLTLVGLHQRIEQLALRDGLVQVDTDGQVPRVARRTSRHVARSQWRWPPRLVDANHRNQTRRGPVQRHSAPATILPTPAVGG